MSAFIVFFSALIIFPLVSLGQFQRVDEDLKKYDEQIQFLITEFNKIKSDSSDKEWVKRKLSHMVEADQYMRATWSLPVKNVYSTDEAAYFRNEFLLRNNNLDSQNTSDIKQLLTVFRWFTISEFGEEADAQAWLIVQHADLDLPFQRRVLDILTDLWPKNETSPKNYAYLFDRVAAAWGDPSKRSLQRYGTQGKCLGPKIWEPIPVEDFDLVDQRRAEVGLNSFDDYKNLVKEFCF